ncbi:hypothetical protein FC26_GL002256 [Paucilactobacillus vaccinostercus DSM 20634]|uniref:HNH nuclease domain-containing protein n=1 Tax=Paucilactobacillus vaccinostercus DSM 20634 TaxID=1423813 RepID=A0A0R2A274_9LACO|nr:HNH endonuclease signature motif containing protein [Paucilactobacillus vaccinostercus]KRM61040.1 hypothetical protein FC26_GL002256 [Paucilactobacillus vaccinostercus DSM 20634]
MDDILYENGTAFVDGYKFRKDSKSGYYLSTKKIGSTRKRLHVYIWEKYNGEIPKGYQIHHYDENKDHNDISNLMCMTKHEHHMWHSEHDRNKMLPKWNHSLDKARIKAAEWHRSPEGRTQASKTHKGIKIRKKYMVNCLNCGKTFRAARPSAKFCSPDCQSAYRRRSGVDNETRKCVVCGSSFVTNKYSKARTCSRKCAAQLMLQKKASNS